jgi:hypothetical protein
MANNQLNIEDKENKVVAAAHSVLARAAKTVSILGALHTQDGGGGKITLDTLLHGLDVTFE